MNRSTVYDDDILEWSEQQAAALRRAAHARPNVSNEIDWENVAEEIESVGRSEFASVVSYLHQILVHLIKGVSVPEATPLLHWRSEVVAFHRNMLDRISPSMHARIDLSKLWRQALVQAAADLAVHGQTVAVGLPRECPLGLDQVLDADFDYLAVVEALRQRYDGKPSA